MPVSVGCRSSRGKRITAQRVIRLVKQECGMARADRQRISERLAPMVLSAYRSQDGIEQSLRAFGTPDHTTNPERTTRGALVTAPTARRPRRRATG
ncbi:hypothetical protein ABT187_36960 [Streptomyces sp. NPDC001817]|uniref:hypothetical protein n=1 Tax=Streptomyces sp. NPDC001817 TaxID=3154398 RepID=UPI00332EEF75